MAREIINHADASDEILEVLRTADEMLDAYDDPNVPSVGDMHEQVEAVAAAVRQWRVAMDEIRDGKR